MAGVARLAEERHQEAAADQRLGDLVRPVRRRVAGACHDEPDVPRPATSELVTISLDDPDKKDDALKVLKENHVAATNYLLNIR